MCGIAGYIDSSQTAETRRESVELMCRAMVHRGPDDEGIAGVGPATLGMRRLAIFDPAHGRQPMCSVDGRFTLIFNGAIYNFRELREELQSLGHGFKTECDTEVLLAAYVQWGEASLRKLRGMFAFAVWDSREKTLFIARDPFGIKPLYFSHIGQAFVFASEIRALLRSNKISTEIDPTAVRESLAYLAVPAPRTLYRHIQSLRPGESAVWCDGELLLHTYWSFQDASHAPFTPCVSREDFIRQLREKLEDTIRAHSLADVPVGAFLSGGLDSAVIVGLMSRQQSAALKTFSIGFDETAFSESSAAEATARHFGTQHQTYILSGDQVANDLPRIIGALDQPTGDAINTYYVSQFARAGGVTVALSGLGGDELFGGYPWFETTPNLANLVKIWRVVPAPLREILLGCFRGRGARAEKLEDLLKHGHDFHQLAALQRRNFSESALSSLLKEPEQFVAHQELSRLSEELSGTDAFSAISAWEMRTYMADVLLRDSDVMSMRHSLELRVPFVDRPLIEWFWRQPERFKRSPQPKKSLADATADLLPPNLAGRRKQGFTLPFPIWMRGALRPFLEDTFSTASVSRSGFLNTAGVQARWQRFLAGNDSREWSRIWSLAILIAFLNRPSSTR